MKCRHLAPAAVLLLAAIAVAAPPDEKPAALPLEGGEVAARFQPERRGPRLGGVVLLPDPGVATGLGAAIGALFHALPDHGWSALAVPLSPFAGETAAWLDTTRLRIAAAVAHLHGQGIRDVVVVGHGLGALAAADYAASSGAETIQGLVVIALPASTSLRADPAELLSRSPAPVLDLFGSRGRADTLASADRRAAAARAALVPVTGSAMPRSHQRPAYRQVVVEGADHDFTTEQETLVRRVRGWLQRHVSRGTAGAKESP